MADDWQVGDLALCVDDTPCGIFPGSEGGVHKGSIYLVEAVQRLRDIYRRECTGLQLDRHNPTHPVTGATGFHNAIRFVKIRPLSDEERDSFLADLRVPVEA